MRMQFTEGAVRVQLDALVLTHHVLLTNPADIREAARHWEIDDTMDEDKIFGEIVQRSIADTMRVLKTDDREVAITHLARYTREGAVEDG